MQEGSDKEGSFTILIRFKGPEIFEARNAAPVRQLYTGPWEIAIDLAYCKNYLMCGVTAAFLWDAYSLLPIGGF